MLFDLRKMRAAAAAGSLALLAACTAVIDQSTFFPPDIPPPAAAPALPAGYALTEALLELPGLGVVHAVRLDNPASETAIVYSGGKGEEIGPPPQRAGA